MWADGIYFNIRLSDERPRVLAGVCINYRLKLENIDLWETAVIRNNKSAVEPLNSSAIVAA